jgi:hypothetical protein
MLQTGRRALRVAAVAAVAAAGLVMTAGAGGAGSPSKPRTVTWTQTGIGTLISQNGSTVIPPGLPTGTLVVGAFKDSLDGNGAFVGTTSNNTETNIGYVANGVSKVFESPSYTPGAPDANGMIPYTGSGKCTGGTGVHKHEKCSYTFTGTLNPKTTVFSYTITGTKTR